MVNPYGEGAAVTQLFPSHIVAVIGGAVAGSEAAKILAERGIGVVIFDQNPRPYGKIEEGLPRWLDKMRIAEYGRIDEVFRHPLVSFVPSTRISRDVSFEELTSKWGFSCVILANGAWRDRPLGIKDIDAYIGKGFFYQNPFMCWFNHAPEKDYTGPQCEVCDGAIVIGGGLASIDVAKALMLESIRVALGRQEIEIDMVTLERKGCEVVLKENNLTLDALGVTPCTLFYRRTLEEMPLVAYKEGATEEQKRATEKTRLVLLKKAMSKYLFRTQASSRPVDTLVDRGRLVGLRFIRTETRQGKLVDIAGSEFEVRANLTISSIGSIPEPLTGVPMRGELYLWKGWEQSQLDHESGIFGLGNVVTGKGNIAVSRKHSKFVADHVGRSYLGVASKTTTEGVLALEEKQNQLEHMAQKVEAAPPLSQETCRRILMKVKERQQQVGYAGNYDEWIKRWPPLDLQGFAQ